jgi:hypothetical protein
MVLVCLGLEGGGAGAAGGPLLAVADLRCMSIDCQTVFLLAARESEPRAGLDRNRQSATASRFSSVSRLLSLPATTTSRAPPLATAHYTTSNTAHDRTNQPSRLPRLGPRVVSSDASRIVS